MLNPDKINELREIDEDGSDTVLKTLIGLFLNTSPPKLLKMTQALATQDLSTARKEAHSLRSSSLTLGADTLARFAAEIEYAKEDENTAQVIQTGIENASTEFELLKIELAKYL